MSFARAGSSPAFGTKIRTGSLWNLPRLPRKPAVFSAWSPGRGRAGSNRRNMSINPGKIDVFFRIRFDKTGVNI